MRDIPEVVLERCVDVLLNILFVDTMDAGFDATVPTEMETAILRILEAAHYPELVAALRFYASDSSYTDMVWVNWSTPSPPPRSEIMLDKGNTARAALRKAGVTV